MTVEWDMRWGTEEASLESAWKAGSAMRYSDSKTADRAEQGELVTLPWKGGCTKYVKAGKYGPLYYLAMWQGLRGETLDIVPTREYELVCTATQTRVIFTADVTRWSNAK